MESRAQHGAERVSQTGNDSHFVAAMAQQAMKGVRTYVCDPEVIVEELSTARVNLKEMCGELGVAVETFALVKEKIVAVEAELVSHEIQLGDSQPRKRNLVKQFQDAMYVDQVNTEESNAKLEERRQLRD